MLVHLGRGLSPVCNAGSAPSLRNAISSTVFDIDSTISASFSQNSQIWSNIANPPADSSNQSAYHFALGANTNTSTDDPTFIGTDGNKAAYFLLDGGDSFTLANTTNSAFLNALHKTTGGTNFWVAIAMCVVDQNTVSVILSTKTASSTIGFNIQFTSTEQVRFQQTGDSGVTTTTQASDHPAITVGTNSVIIASYNTTSGILRSWVNNRNKVERSMLFNPTAAAASGALSLGSQANGGSSKISAGTRLYAVSMGNAFIDDTEASVIFNTYNTRHKRTYA